MRAALLSRARVMDERAADTFLKIADGMPPVWRAGSSNVAFIVRPEGVDIGVDSALLADATSASVVVSDDKSAGTAGSFGESVDARSARAAAPLTTMPARRGTSAGVAREKTPAARVSYVDAAVMALVGESLESPPKALGALPTRSALVRADST